MHPNIRSYRNDIDDFSIIFKHKFSFIVLSVTRLNEDDCKVVTREYNEYETTNNLIEWFVVYAVAHLVCGHLVLGGVASCLSSSLSFS